MVHGPQVPLWVWLSGVRMGEIDLCAALTVCIIGKIPSFVPAITFQLVNSKGNNALPPSIFKFH